MNRILCPVDFSPTSLNAIEFAVEIGRKFHSNITLFHVFTEADFNTVVGQASAGKSFKELMAMAGSRLKALSEDINQNTGDEVQCDYEVSLGELLDKIKEFSRNFDLLVMGTTGVSRVEGILFGSNTEKVIDEIRIPILCIPEKSSYAGFRKMVYASDFSDEDRVVIQKVISFATVFNARINILHINLGDDEKAYKAFVEELRSFIQYDRIGFVNKDFRDEVRLGLEEYMREENADLLVVYKKHRSFVGSMFHKSLTKTLSYSTDKPLFVLKLDSN